MVGKCLEWCSFHGTPKRCQIGATPKLSLQKTEAWKLKNRCGAGACGGGRTRARTWDPMIKRHPPRLDISSKFSQLRQNPNIRDQWLTAKNPTMWARQCWRIDAPE